MFPKCQRCGSRFDPAFSASRLLCGDCLEVVTGKISFIAHVSPSASPETLLAVSELLTLAAVQAEKGNLTPDAADLRHACGDCGAELQIVRPGKYQCVNPKCGASR